MYSRMSTFKIHGQMSVFVLYCLWKVAPEWAYCENRLMREEKKTGRKLTQARKEANARYNSKFVEVKVRMTPERRSVVQDHAESIFHIFFIHTKMHLQYNIFQHLFPVLHESQGEV